MNAFAEVPFCFALMLSLYGVEHVTNSLEFLSLRHQFHSGGAMAWRRLKPGANLRSRAVGILASQQSTILLLWVQLVFAFLAPISLWYEMTAPAPFVCGLALLRLWHNLRFRQQRSGADTMSASIIVSAALWSLQPNDTVLGHICLSFVAIQLALAYLGTALAKLVSGHWRSGRHLISVFQSGRATRPLLGRWLYDHPRIAFAATWYVISLECVLSVAYLLSPSVTAAFALQALAFHFFISVVMGYRSFFWIFGAGQVASIHLAWLISK